MKVEFKIKSGKKVEMIVLASILSCKVEGKEIGGLLEINISGLPNGYVALVGKCLPIDEDQLAMIEIAMEKVKPAKRHISDLCPKCGSYCYGDC